MFSIREFIYPDDYQAVIQLWESAGPGVHVRRSDQIDQIKRKLERDPDLFLLAESEGQIVGSVLGGFDGRRGMVYHLAVAVQFRRHGIGAALMEELEARLKAKGCIRSYLLVTRDNHQAVKFYEDRGWDLMDIHVFGKNLD